jgi:hypothetical protein
MAGGHLKCDCTDDGMQRKAALPSRHPSFLPSTMEVPWAPSPLATGLSETMEPRRRQPRSGGLDKRGARPAVTGDPLPVQLLHGASQGLNTSVTSLNFDWAFQTRQGLRKTGIHIGKLYWDREITFFIVSAAVHSTGDSMPGVICGASS